MQNAMSVGADRGSLPHRVNAVIQRALSEQRLVGVVVLIAHKGEIAYRGAAGFADRETHRPMQEDTIFRFSSLTKQWKRPLGMPTMMSERVVGMNLAHAARRSMPS